MFKWLKKKKEIVSCPEKGIFVLKGEIDNDMACNVVKGMLDYSSKHPEKIITLHIDCEGGLITAGMAIYDTMRAVPNPKRTIAHKNAGGIAALLLCAGSRGMRIAHPNTRISLGQFYISTDVTNVSPLLYQTMDKICALFAMHTGNTSEQIKELLKPQYLNIGKAMQSGVIDRCDGQFEE